MYQEEGSLALRICLSADGGLYKMTATLPKAGVEVTSSGTNLIEVIEQITEEIIEQLAAKGYEVDFDGVISAIGYAVEDAIQQASQPAN